MLNVLYCSSFRSHRTHRELVRLAGEHNCRINALPWEETEFGHYTGPFPVDGVIGHLDPDRYAPLLPNIGEVPSVTLHARTTSELGVPGVVCDHYAAGRMVAKHFIDLGFTQLAAFVDTAAYHTFERRFLGYADAIAEAGLPSPVKIELSERARRSTEKTLELFGEALSSLPLPLAIMAANDRVAVKLMDACLYHDFSIPAQVAICGFDNDPITCDVAPVPLSSVDTDPEAQAREAFMLLMSLISGGSAPREPVVIAPRRLVVRRSSGLPAQASSTTAKAIAFIHDQLETPGLSIPDISGHVGVSRTKLFQSFQRSLSLTPLQYITDLRVEKARRLLKETSQKINEIRPQCGFATDYQMYRAFKRTTGKSPTAFR